MIDCLIVGFNDGNFEEYVKMVRAMGADAGAYRDLDLALVEHEGRPYRSMDILNHFYFEGGPAPARPFSNSDFLWPVVLYLGTYLSRRGFSFDYVNLFHLEKERLREKLARGDVRTVAITTTLYVSPHPILEIVSFVREHSPSTRVIVGGPYVANQAKALDEHALKEQLKYLGADIYVISQEGEHALAETLGALRRGSSLDGVDNIAYRSGGSYVLTRASIESNPLEENMVDYRLFPREEIGQFVSVRTAKSCPFSCSFCGFPQRAGKYKYTGVELVEQELNALRETGTVTTVTFLDDTFNVPKQRFKDILRMMIRNRYDFRWNCFYRSDQGDEEVIELMAEAGCEGVFLGVEAGSDVMLANMNKTSRRHHYARAIPLLREAGISTYASLIVGFPGETYDTIRDTVDLIETARPEFFRAQLWYCDPLTPIWERREEHGIRGSAFSWSHNTMDSQTACDLIEKMFLSVENSIWLPQFGFEQWSTFYLQRHGMSREQLRTFLRCFNAVKKEQLLHPERKEISPALLASLRASSRFDRDEPLDMRAVEALSGARYAEAERFWVDSFAGEAQPPASAQRGRLGEGEAGWGEVEFEAGAAALGRLREVSAAEDETLLLAAFSVLLSRVGGREETPLVYARAGAGAVSFPLKLFPSWGMGFAEYAGEVARLLALAARHEPFGFYVMTNPFRLAEYGAAPQSLEAMFLFCGPGAELDESDPSRGGELISRAGRDVGLVLRATPGATPGADAAAGLSLFYRRERFGAETAGELASCLTNILEAAARDADTPLGDIELGGQSSPEDLFVESDASELFQF